MLDNWLMSFLSWLILGYLYQIQRQFSLVMSYLTYPSYIRCMMYLIHNITCVTCYNSDLIFKFFMDDLLWALSSTWIKEFYRDSFLLFIILIFEKAIISQVNSHLDLLCSFLRVILPFLILEPSYFLYLVHQAPSIIENPLM
jgi:hypothetical protein